MKRITLIECILVISMITSCRLNNNPPAVYTVPSAPASSCQLVATQDTIVFKLSEEAFGDIESWNVRWVDTQTIVSLFDQFSLTISEYAYPSLKRIKVIDLSRYFKAGEIKSAYIQDYQNIYLTSRSKLYVTDTSGKIKSKFDFGSPGNSKTAKIMPGNPLTFKDNKVFLSLYPGVDRTSKLAMRKWEIMWSADLENKTIDTRYHFPGMYFDNIYIAPFLSSSYCVNDSGRFVISFTADTLLYETDLKNYHRAWFAKSRYEKKARQSVPRDKTVTALEEWKIHVTNNTYGAVFYDRARKRYLRLTRAASPENEIHHKDFRSLSRVIILDKNFHIIGESDLPKTVAFKNSLFTPDGNIYSRIKSKLGDEITFIRMEYRENQLTTIKK